MGLQLLGLGFTFGGKDAGLGSMLDGLNDRVSSISDSLENLGKNGLSDAAKALGSELPQAANEGAGALNSAMGEMTGRGFSASAAMAFLSAETGGMLTLLEGGAETVGAFMESLVPPSPRAMLDNLNGLRAGMNLTTGLEATMQGLAVSARAMGANFGYTGQQLNSFIHQSAGLAQGLNIGADEASRAVRAFTEAGTEFQALGLHSARDVARFTAGFGINADMLRNTAMNMTREFGLSTDAVGRVMSAVAAYGQVSGDVAGAFGDLPQMMEQMRQQASLMGMELDPDRMESFARQSMGLAAGLFQIGQDSTTARSAALELNTALVGAQRDFQNLFSGTATDLSSFIQEVAIAGGSVTGAFDLMQSGPQGFVEGMANMVQELRNHGGATDRQLDFIRSRLSSVLGEEAGARLTDFFRTADDAALATMTTVSTATRDLGEMGREAHRTGRTMAENFELMQEGAEMAFRSIARHDTGEFMGRARAAMTDVRDGMRRITEAGGPAADILHRMSLADQIGGMAFLPEQLQGTAVAAQAMGNQISETVSAFTSLGGIMDMVSTGVALFTTQIALNMSEGQSWTEAFDATANQFADIAIGLIDDVFGPEGYLFQGLDAFANFDFDSLFGAGAGATSGLGGAFHRVFSRLSDVDWSGLASRLGQGFQNLWNLIDWDATRHAVRDAFHSAWAWAAENIPWAEIGEELGSDLNAAWTFLQPYVMQGLGALGQWILDGLPVVAVAIGAWLASPAMGAALMAGLTGLAGLIGQGLLAALVFAIESVGAEGSVLAGIGLLEVLGPGIGTALAGLGAFLTGPIGLAVAGVLLAVWGLWEIFGDDITSFFQDTIQSVVDWFADHFPRTFSVLQRVAASWSARLSQFGTWFTGMWGGLMDGLGAAWEGFTSLIGTAWDFVVEHASEGVQAFIATFFPIASTLMPLIEPVFALLGGVWDQIVAGSGSATESIDSFAASFLEGLIDPVAAAQTAWTGFGATLQTVWMGIETMVGPIIQRVQDLITNFGTNASGAFHGVMDTVVELFGHSVNSVVGEDMAETQAVVTETTDAVAAHLEEVLFGATVQALTEGFATAFEQILESTDVFGETMGEGFTTLADNISEIMVNLYSRIVEGAALSATGIDAFVGPLVQRLGQLADAQERLLSVRAEADALVSPVADSSRSERLADLTADLRAIHDPDWYRNDYRDLFITKMNQVVAAVGSASAPSTSTAATPEQLRQILDAIGSTRTGGSSSEPLGGTRQTRGRGR